MNNGYDIQTIQGLFGHKMLQWPWFIHIWWI